MNLKNLFDKQKELDDYIVKTKGLEGHDLLPQKILALQVELGECANEWRGFKFWSNDQNPRNYCQACNMIETEHVHKNPLLEEYVDCLHFILSIGNAIGVPTDHPYATYNELGESETVTDIFITCYNDISAYMTDGYVISDVYHFLELIRDFCSLGYILGFTWEQIEQAYITKWNINKQRQENGY